jgi:hypothetical protein
MDEGPLYLACLHKQSEMVKFLLSVDGIDVNRKNAVDFANEVLAMSLSNSFRMKTLLFTLLV